MAEIYGFDAYEDDFQKIVLPEHEGKAEQLLLETIEACEPKPEELLQARLTDEYARDKESYTFLFDVMESSNGKNGGFVLSYKGYY